MAGERQKRPLRMDTGTPPGEAAAPPPLTGLRIDRRSPGVGRRRRRGAALALVLALALAGVGLVYGPEFLRPAVEVRLARVSAVWPTQTFTVLTASGYVVPQRKAALGAKITSRLVELTVEEGSRVSAGQLVARLEHADLAAARDRARTGVDVARADLAQAEAEREEASLAFQRIRELLERKFVSRSEFDVAEARYKVAEAAVQTRRAGLASQAARQNVIQLGVGRFGKQHHVQRMIGDFAAVCGKMIQTFGQGALQVSEAANIGIGYLAQLSHIIIEGRQLDVEGFIRAPARQHFDVKGVVFGDSRVVLKRINRIVGGTDHLHIHLLHDSAGGEGILSQQIITLVPDLIGGGWRQQLTCNTKRTT